MGTVVSFLLQQLDKQNILFSSSRSIHFHSQFKATESQQRRIDFIHRNIVMN